MLAAVREKLRAAHYSPRTEHAYVGWIKRFIGYHRTTHPNRMGEAEVVAFLTDLAVRRRLLVGGFWVLDFALLSGRGLGGAVVLAGGGHWKRMRKVWRFLGSGLL